MDRKTYMKSYRADYKKRVKIVKVTLRMSEFAKLKATAKTEGVRPATLACEYIKEALTGDPRVPASIEAEIKAVRHLIRNIGNNINQIAHHSNTIKRVADERGLFRWLKALEGHVADYTSGKLK